MMFLETRQVTALWRPIFAWFEHTGEKESSFLPLNKHADETRELRQRGWAATSHSQMHRYDNRSTGSPGRAAQGSQWLLNPLSPPTQLEHLD